MLLSCVFRCSVRSSVFIFQRCSYTAAIVLALAGAAIRLPKYATKNVHFLVRHSSPSL